MMIDPMLLPAPADDSFTDESYLSAAQKWHVLRDWQRFMLSGFQKLFFTPGLYRFLADWIFPVHHNQERCWHYYFNAELTHLRQFLADLANSEPRGLSVPATDLKVAVCQATEPFYAPLSQVLQDLEYKHQEMIAAWYEFALNSGIQDATLPPAYTVSENTRHLLAYAVQIALERQRSLPGLQLLFPFHYEMLLGLVPTEAQA